jgi:hypothetical protein
MLPCVSGKHVFFNTALPCKQRELAWSPVHQNLMLHPELVWPIATYQQAHSIHRYMIVVINCMYVRLLEGCVK